MEKIIFIQAIGFVAFAVQMSAYMRYCPRQILFQQAGASVLWASHFFAMGFIPLAVLAFCSSFRNIAASKLERRHMIAFLSFFACSMVTYLSFHVEKPIDIFPIIAVIGGVIVCLFRDKRVIFLACSLCMATGWLTLHIVNGSIAGVLNEMCMLGVICLAILRPWLEQNLFKPKLQPAVIAAE